jgi:hypothetical protein
MKFKVGDKVRIVKCVYPDGDNRKPIGIGEVHTIISCDNFCKYPYLLDAHKELLWCDEELELVPQDKILITTDGKITTATKYCEDGKKITATARCAPEDTFNFNVGAKLAMERLMRECEPVICGGFKVGDRVHMGKFNGTVICIAKSEFGSTYNDIGVEFDDVSDNPGIHNCGGITLAAGTKSKTDSGRCKWCYPKELEHGEYVPKYYNGKVVCTDNVSNTIDYTIGKIYEFIDGTFKSDFGTYVHEFRGRNCKFKSFNEWKQFSTAKWLEIKE